MSEQKKIRGFNYTVEEDATLCRGYVNTTTDPILGADRKNDNFFEGIRTRLKLLKPDAPPGTYYHRPISSIKQRIGRIKSDCSLFLACLNRVQTLPSGTYSEEARWNIAAAIHTNKATMVDAKFSTFDAAKHWKFFKAWLVLKDLPIMVLPDSDLAPEAIAVPSPPATIITGTSGSLADEDSDVTIEHSSNGGTSISGGGTTVNVGLPSRSRPIGKKKAVQQDHAKRQRDAKDEAVKEVAKLLKSTDGHAKNMSADLHGMAVNFARKEKRNAKKAQYTALKEMLAVTDMSDPEYKRIQDKLKKLLMEAYDQARDDALGVNDAPEEGANKQGDATAGDNGNSEVIEL
jgi:hypothetical protein